MQFSSCSYLRDPGLPISSKCFWARAIFAPDQAEGTGLSKERSSSCSPQRDEPRKIFTKITVLQTGVSNSGRITVFGAVFFRKQTASPLHVHISASLMSAHILLAWPLKSCLFI